MVEGRNYRSFLATKHTREHSLQGPHGLKYLIRCQDGPMKGVYDIRANECVDPITVFKSGCIMLCRGEQALFRLMKSKGSETRCSYYYFL